MSRKTGLAVLAVFCLLNVAVGNSRAQVVLKPKGQSGSVLRTRSIDANVVIEKQIATTNLTLTFQNTVAERIEADFIYAVAPGTVVTHFAHWYGKEKVIARIVEKERAATIYSYITTRMRDPALIEMTGKNTFRARIFPVMPNADLKVEMVLVQALPSDISGYSYSLPIKMEKGNPLDSLKIAVWVKPEAHIQRLENNYGVSVVTDADGYRLDIEGQKVRPDKDLRVHVVREPEPVQAELYAARSGGPDGFFALSLTSAHDIKNAKVHFSGVKTYDLIPA